ERADLGLRSQIASKRRRVPRTASAGATGIGQDVTERNRAAADLRLLAREQAALRRVATYVASADDPSSVFDIVARRSAGCWAGARRTSSGSSPTPTPARWWAAGPAISFLPGWLAGHLRRADGARTGEALHTPGAGRRLLGRPRRVRGRDSRARHRRVGGRADQRRRGAVGRGRRLDDRRRA